VTTPVERTGGHTLVEAIVALGLMALVMSGVIALVFHTSRLARTHPDRFEAHQRARVALDLLTRDLRTAGAGVYLGPATGPLAYSIPAIWPRHVGRGGDAPTTARADALTIVTVPDTLAQTRSQSALGPSSLTLIVDPAAHCTPSRPACGFGTGTTISVFDASGRVGLWSVDRVTSQTLTLDALSTSDDVVSAGAVVTEVLVRGYRHDAVTNQLRYFDGDATDQPVIDGVTALVFQYFDEHGELPVAVLGDGPWRSSGATMFDEDVLRVRRVRVNITIVAGVARYSAVVDIAPRNARAS
jgi:Tfp pilus assembly protein PilW